MSQKQHHDDSNIWDILHIVFVVVFILSVLGAGGYAYYYFFYKDKEETVTYTLKGADGAIKIKEIMDTIRNNPPEKLGGYTVLERRDYKTGITVDTKTGKEGKTTLPTSNVLYYAMENDVWCCVRPSGTEPKIKFYMGVKGKSIEDAEKQLENLKRDMLALAER